MPEIPSDYRDLFTKPTIAHLGTLMPAGAPHVTPVWIDYDPDDNRVLVNTAKGRQKHVNVQHDPGVGVSMVDPDDPYRRFAMIGTVTSMTDEHAAAHIDSLEQRYRGNDTYQGDRTNRIILEIRPYRILTRA